MTHGNLRWTQRLTDINKTEVERMREFFAEALDQSGRRDRFLAAWKRGIELAGEEYFNVTAESIEAAHVKDQLQPIYKMIQDAIGRISAGQGAFLAAMYSFYNADDGQKLLTAAGYPNIADLASKLDPEHADIITVLFLNYGGW